jgi:hypothetical protein
LEGAAAAEVGAGGILRFNKDGVAAPDDRLSSLRES